MMDCKFVRVLRTPYSERFVLQNRSGDFAALDLHYLPDGKVNGTLIIFDNAGVAEKDIPALLARVDEDILPDASVEAGNLSFTVVIGRVLGAFQAEKKG